MNIFSKINQRINQFKKHPITKDRLVKSLVRYLVFNILIRLFDRIKIKWIKSLQFYAYKGDAGIVGNIYFGLYEFYESIFLLHFLRKDDVFVDIGANVGHYTLLASGIMGSKSIAIEPIPEIFSKLRDNIHLNNLETKVDLLNMGVGDKKTELYFSTNRGTMNRIVSKNNTSAVRIGVDTLDNLLQMPTTTLLKIDTEGYEKFVLTGSKKTLENDNLKAIIIELNNSGKNYQIDDLEVFELLLNHGFKPFDYDYQNRKVKELASFKKKQFNTIFLRDIEFVKNRLKKAKKVSIFKKRF